MAGHLIANIDVHPDRVLPDRYRQAVTQIIAQYGGRYLVRKATNRDLTRRQPAR